MNSLFSFFRRNVLKNLEGIKYFNEWHAFPKAKKTRLNGFSGAFLAKTLSLKLPEMMHFYRHWKAGRMKTI
jgi:hypothetical protein